MAAQNVEQSYFQTGGLNTYVSPLLGDGVLIHAVNVDTFPYGAKTKRQGYSAFLGTPDNSQVQSLFDFHNIGNDSTKFNLYRASGSLLYYSLQGTGAWTVAGNGTITSGGHFGHAVLDNVLIGGDGVPWARAATTTAPYPAQSRAFL